MSKQKKKTRCSKLIQKHPTVKDFSYKAIKTTMYVKSQTPYVSALKRINKFLNQLEKYNAKYVTVLGMGKATEKILSIGCHFQNQRSYKVEIRTTSAQVIDEILENDDKEDGICEEDKETKLQVRTVSGIELRIYPI